ncbi:MAG TPA: Zn-dependent alcohol dehydrogenase [Methylomirabilota bacterium]|nr:Zn-dependent alcohol dehydrogenase [Methylomirabilota bacterium]
MKAAVCWEAGKPLVVEEVVLDPPKTGEVRVRIGAVAICHSDVHLVRGDWTGWSSTPPPVVAGHEAAGVVDEVGPGVTRVRPGDRVVVSLLRTCGACVPCLTGAAYLCEGRFALLTEHRLHARTGQPLNLGIRVAGFAEATVVDQSQLVSVPADLRLDRACLLACGVITGVGAVLNTAQLTPGSSAVIIGAGGVGVNAIQGAALAGASPLVAVDIVPAKLPVARTFGATHAVDGRHADLPRLVRELTGGRGADYVFVTVGNPAVVSQALTLARRGGTVVLVGMPAAGATAPIPIGDFAGNGLRLLGSNMGSTRLGVDVPRLVARYQEGRLQLDELITARYPLERINEAIVAMEGGQALRNVIVFPAVEAA